MIIERLHIRLLRLPLVRHFETSFARSYDRHFLLVRLEGTRATVVPIGEDGQPLSVSGPGGEPVSATTLLDATS